MKNLFILISLVFSLSSLASISIISDLDDTIKITNSGDTLEGAINAALKSDVFNGITEFFLGAKDYSNELHVLSASPTILRGKIVSTLKKRQIDYASIILKNYAVKESKFTYKVKAIKKLMEDSSDDFILIGDDVGEDPEAYGEIQRQYPNRVLAIYIHVIKNRSIPAGTKYWTSFDLFLREFMAGRMSAGRVEKGTQSVFAEKNLNKVIPGFAHCPKNVMVWSWQFRTFFAQEAFKVARTVLAHCLSPNSDILASH